MNGTYLQGRECAKEWLRDGKEWLIAETLKKDRFHLCRTFGENWVKGFMDVVA